MNPNCLKREKFINDAVLFKQYVTARILQEDLVRRQAEVVGNLLLDHFESVITSRQFEYGLFALMVYGVRHIVREVSQVCPDHFLTDLGDLIFNHVVNGVLRLFVQLLRLFIEFLRLHVVFSVALLFVMTGSFLNLPIFHVNRIELLFFFMLSDLRLHFIEFLLIISQQLILLCKFRGCLLVLVILLLALFFSKPQLVFKLSDSGLALFSPVIFLLAHVFSVTL